jgi:hypothetical protein
VDSVGAPVAAVALDFGQWLPYVDHTLSSRGRNEGRTLVRITDVVAIHVSTT